MNRVENLFKTPFYKLTLDQKLEVKRLGPYQPKPCPLVQDCGGVCRTFRTSWYEKAEWLCYGEEKDALFCFYCLLFCTTSQSPWVKSGVRDLKHLSVSVKKHKSTNIHLGNAVKFKTLGSTNVASKLDESYAIAIRRHNEAVAKNRHILQSIIDAIKFLAIHELPFRGHDETEQSSNRGAFLDLLDYTATKDKELRYHLDTSTVVRNTSKDIQNELLDAMYQIYIGQLQSDISSCDFLSIQSDETTDVTCISQLAVVFRYVKDGRPVERFHSFIRSIDRTASGIYEVLKSILLPYDVQTKLIAQTYDGAAVMSGSRNGVQALLKRDFPYAHFLHCYAHQLNLVVKRMCSDVPPARLFFANVSAFSSFFSTSPKRSDALRKICKRRLPSCVQTRWNFQSRVIRGVFDIKSELLQCFSEIESSPSFTWDDRTLQEAAGLRRLLEDAEFSFFLEFFAGVFYHVEVLFNAFQSRFIDGASVESCTTGFCDAISGIRNNISFPADEATLRHNKSKQSITSSARECCDVLMTQLTDRLNTEHLRTFSLLHPPKFSTYSTDFPYGLLASLQGFFPMINSKQLESELRCIYSNPILSKAKTSSELLGILIDNSLITSFPSASQFLNIILTTPVSSAESERCFSTLKRIKTFLRNRTG